VFVYDGITITKIQYSKMQTLAIAGIVADKYM
jgi:hypothetical protein